METEYLTAFLAGLLGGVHCLGMCGGIVASLSLSLPAPVNKTSINSKISIQNTNNSMMGYMLFYNIGRISSYTLAGILFGGFSMLAAKLVDMHTIQIYLQIFAASLMIALGLYLGGWWAGVSKLEKLGNPIWKRIEPVSRQFIPVTSQKNAFFLGILWGWLPCGLVYTILFMAIASASFIKGGLIMFSFGLGTLPMLLLMGVFATSLREFVRDPWVKKLAGMTVILFAIYSLLLVYYSVKA